MSRPPQRAMLHARRELTHLTLGEYTTTTTILNAHTRRTSKESSFVFVCLGTPILFLRPGPSLLRKGVAAPILPTTLFLLQKRKKSRLPPTPPHTHTAALHVTWRGEKPPPLHHNTFLRGGRRGFASGCAPSSPLLFLSVHVPPIEPCARPPPRPLDGVRHHKAPTTMIR